MVSIPHVKEEQWVFALQFYLDHFGIPHLDKATINEIYYEDAPVKTTTTTTPTTTNTTTTENKEQTTEGTTETPKVEEKKVDKVKKERSTVCIVKLAEILYGLPQSFIDAITQREATQEADDRLLFHAINKRNEIENFIYSTRSKFDGDLASFVTNEEKEILLALMQKMEDWLYSGDENVYVKTILEEQAKELNDLGTKIYKRYHDWGKLGESLNKLEQCVNLNVKKLEENTPQTANLNQTDRDEISNLIVTYNNLLNEGRVQFNKFPKFADPPARFEDVDKASEELVKVNQNYF
jgi:hypothetical protein